MRSILPGCRMIARATLAAGLTLATLQAVCAQPQVGRTYRIGFSQIVDHPALNATRQGFIDGLKAEGFEVGRNLMLDYQNAQGDVGTARNEIQEAGQYVPFDQLTLGAGEHTVKLHYGGGDWRPGSGGPPDTVGPLALSLVAPRLPLISVPAADAEAGSPEAASGVAGWASKLATSSFTCA